MAGFGFTVLVIFGIIVNASAKSSLEHVQVLFRHGQRSPVDAYPTDVYKEKFWPDGFGQLTQLGMKQHYELGQFLREQYVEDTGFMDSRYSRYQISIWSTDIDRTLMSAAVDLAGFFPPQGNQIWNTAIPWQPIPVHTMTATEDYYLSYSAYCPKYNELQNESLELEDYVTMSNKYAGYMKELNTNSGFNGSIMIDNIFHVSDPLKVEKEHNLELPKWTKVDHFWETLSLLSTYSMGQMVNSTARARLKGGPLLGLMIKNMREYMNTSVPSHDKVRFHMYSAHDVTVTSFLTALQLFNDILPPYASAVGVELWKNNDNKKSTHSVRVWYRNDTQVAPYNLTIPGCDVDCPFNDFVELTKDRTLAEEDIQSACGLEITENYWIPTLIGIGLVVLLVLFVVTYLIVINRRLRSHKLLDNTIEDPW